MEMLLGSASVTAYQDQPGLSRTILSPTGSDLEVGGVGGSTAKINQAQFQRGQTLKTVATTARLNNVGSTLGGACHVVVPKPEALAFVWAFPLASVKKE